jgi:hypothetical protein
MDLRFGIFNKDLSYWQNFIPNTHPQFPHLGIEFSGHDHAAYFGRPKAVSSISLLRECPQGNLFPKALHVGLRKTCK